MTKKKLKEKRQKRKLERFEDEEINEIYFESLKIDIPDFPVLSFN